MDARFYRPDAPEEDFAMRIDRNGQWYHRGSPIGRDKIAQLFSTVLHRDPATNDYWLITPHEQGRITVEDVPYIVIDYTLEGDTLTLTTNLGHRIIADTDHIISCDTENGLAYVPVHNNVSARLNRFVREQLIDIALDRGEYDTTQKCLTLTLNGIRHTLALDETA